MKAYIASFEGEEWVSLIHGETRGKAKARFLRCEPSGWADSSFFPSIRLKHLPALDDKPFTQETVDAVTPPVFSYPEDENGDEIPEPFVNDCDCELCKEAHK